jgi:hypothetical protein
VVDFFGEEGWVYRGRFDPATQALRLTRAGWRLRVRLSFTAAQAFHRAISLP